MKQVLTFFFVSILLNSVAQQTYVPDDNFEAFLESVGVGNGIPNDDYVTTANISVIPTLNIESLNIADLTGIEDFNSLTDLWCGYNLLTSLDVSQNIALSWLDCQYNQIPSLDLTPNINLAVIYCNNNLLTTLDFSQNLQLVGIHCSDNLIASIDITNNVQLTGMNCSNNQMTTLDVTQNSLLQYLDCSNNSLSSLDVSNNVNLSSLKCENNQLALLNVSQNPELSILDCWDNLLAELDVSSNYVLSGLRCYNNQLTCLNVKNGNNINIVPNGFEANGNSNLFCIEVDDEVWATNNWSLFVDPQTSFSENCNNACSVGIEELSIGEKELFKIVDLIGRETTPKKNKVLIYVYSDGTTERVFEFE